LVQVLVLVRERHQVVEVSLEEVLILTQVVEVGYLVVEVEEHPES
jgi:hypothetical protein